ncbi:MAG TPA: flagellar motor protein MotB [Gemmataceae bacterium]|nr:flagellar motor protein MotB [Gemmataceae bacterium]
MSGHGAGWIVTYSDMITLLMACFIMIITFSSKESEKYGRNRDALLSFGSSKGMAGPAHDGLDHDSVIWRVRPPLAHIGTSGSEMPPLHDDPGLEASQEILKSLQKSSDKTLKDSYTLRIPQSLLFEPNGHLSSSAPALLHALALNVRHLPYDVQIEVGDPADTDKAVTLCEYLFQHEMLHPGRLGVGLHRPADSWDPAVWVSYASRP